MAEEVKQAEWAVITSSYPKYCAVGPISKQTAQRIYHPDKWGQGREAFTYLDAVLFRGDEQSCSLLAERLKSSLALSEEERKASVARHQERVAKHIAAALAKAQGQ